MRRERHAHHDQTSAFVTFGFALYYLFSLHSPSLFLYLFSLFSGVLLLFRAPLLGPIFLISPLVCYFRLHLHTHAQTHLTHRLTFLGYPRLVFLAYPLSPTPPLPTLLSLSLSHTSLSLSILPDNFQQLRPQCTWLKAQRCGHHIFSPRKLHTTSRHLLITCVHTFLLPSAGTSIPASVFSLTQKLS